MAISPIPLADNGQTATITIVDATNTIKDTYTTTEQKCTTVYDTSEKHLGYEVRYRLNGQEATVKMDHDPGERIPVRDGQLVLDRAAAAATSG